jgi:hypothetical protein
MYCPECADERPFEQPECLDGHGADCPERACVVCGMAVLLAPLTQPEETAPEPWLVLTGSPAARVVRPARTAPAQLRADTQPETRRVQHAERSRA